MPVRLIILFEKLAACEAHGMTDVVEDITGFNYVVRWSVVQIICNSREVPAMVKLIVDVLSERG